MSLPHSTGMLILPRRHRENYQSCIPGAKADAESHGVITPKARRTLAPEENRIQGYLPLLWDSFPQY